MTNEIEQGRNVLTATWTVKSGLRPILLMVIVSLLLISHYMKGNVP